MCRRDIPLVGPVKDEVTGDTSRGPEEDLGIESPPEVEDGVMGGVGQGVLSVGRETVGNDTLLGLTTYATSQSIVPNISIESFP